MAFCEKPLMIYFKKYILICSFSCLAYIILKWTLPRFWGSLVGDKSKQKLACNQIIDFDKNFISFIINLIIPYLLINLCICLKIFFLSYS
ncbi:unnamed protein product [Blepharisma stoltei]|uniref:Uncharacterized protein n=1 Tax=Blepharisma stoltei TaxID=1481888 RepID=A0AAU9J772_9CILI|nr:unnamed protein product [Blepharisma stoltei]